MTDLFTFARPRTDLRTVSLFRTPPPRDEAAEALRLAGTFRVRGDLRDAGARLVAQDRSSTLEYFRASGSVRWTATDTEGSEVLDAVLPTSEEGVALAGRYLREHHLADEHAGAPRVGYTRVSRRSREHHSDDDEIRSALHVSYAYSLDGLPVFGPGAKAQVTFGGPRRVVGAYRFWREAHREDEQEVISYDETLELLQRDEAFAELESGNARVTFSDVSLGYYARPPREVQPYLTPVFRFAGTVSTPELERYELVKYVVAVRDDPSRNKRMRRIHDIPSPIFSG